MDGGQRAVDTLAAVAAKPDCPPPASLETLTPEAFASMHYTHVVLDANMPPGISGLLAATAMRTAGYDGVIMGLTGDGSEADKAAFVAAGADVVLVKPAPLTEVARGLRKAAKARAQAAGQTVSLSGSIL